MPSSDTDTDNKVSCFSFYFFVVIASDDVSTEAVARQYAGANIALVIEGH